jgi:hypothetical protein
MRLILFTLWMVRLKQNLGRDSELALRFAAETFPHRATSGKLASVAPVGGDYTSMRMQKDGKSTQSKLEVCMVGTYARGEVFGPVVIHTYICRLLTFLE